MTIVYHDEKGYVAVEIDGEIGLVIVGEWVHYTTADGKDEAIPLAALVTVNA